MKNISKMGIIVYDYIGSDILKNYIVKNENTLINYLVIDLHYTHKEAKKKLTNGQVLVNQKQITQYNLKLNTNDIITITNFNSKLNDNIDIIYEDKNIIVVNKPSNLLTIATTKEKEKTLYHIVSNYLKKLNKKAKIFIIHRLDKETSGIVMFAKSEKIKKLYQDNWDSLVKYRGYIAVVNGIVEKENGIITQYLKENEHFYVYPTNSKIGKKAITHYEVLKINKQYSLLNIEIKTGRKNQIRVAMQSIGHPIVGDLKYGENQKDKKWFGLCAHKLVIKDPTNNKQLNFEIAIPIEFQKLFN